MSEAWNKITVRGHKNDLETISAVMSMLDEGLLIEDFSDVKINEMYGDLIDESVLSADPDKISVSIFLSDEQNPLDCIAFLRDRLISLEIDGTVECENVKEEDWSETWKKYYHPVHLDRITVVPAWQDYTPTGDEVVVKMDPGMAFGTGTHETTRLVIRLLQEEIKGGERVLDVGTGSGILAICAAKLGANHCNAYDIDPDAVRVARENVEKDGATNVTCGVSDLLSEVDLSGGKYNLVVANIVADIILRLLPSLADYMAKGARAILSGIIEPRREEILDAIKENGFTVTKSLSENDWCAIVVEVG